MVSKDSSESSNSDYISDRCVWMNGLKVILDLVGSEFKCGAYSSTNTLIEGAKSHNFFVSLPISLKMVSKDSSESSEHFIFGGLYRYGAPFSSYRGFCVFYSSSRVLECFVKYFWSRNNVLSEVNALFRICERTQMFYGAVGVFFGKFGCENKKISETYLRILCLISWCLEYAFA